MKKFGLIIVVLLAAPAMAAVAAPDGTTSQCWSFNNNTQYGILPDDGGAGNPYPGEPIAMINDLSGNGVQWTDNYGGWFGDEFKIILDIPNQPIANPYKLLTVTMRYQGEVAFLGATGIHLDNTLELFTALNPIIQNDDGWNIYTQQFTIEPNPREEIVVIGLKAPVGAIAAIDQICIQTICVPEPATLLLLTLGAGYVLQRKK
jgi:hypothetical protein